MAYIGSGNSSGVGVNGTNSSLAGGSISTINTTGGAGGSGIVIIRYKFQ